MALSLAVFDAKSYDKKHFDAANGTRGLSIKYFPAKLNRDTAPLATGFDAVCAFVNDEIDAATIKTLEREGVRLIALRNAGYNNVDLKAAFGHLHVVRVPSYSPYAIAEHAVALIMALNRKTHRAYNRTRELNFSLAGLEGFDMRGKVAGIVGTGRIGQIAAKILSGFEMKVLVSDPFPKEDWAKSIGAEYVSLDELFSRSDLISLHCPLTPENTHLVDAARISRMRDGVMLINTGRGALIDTKALIDGLKTGKVGAAGLDVYEEEDEYFFEDHSTGIVTDDVLARLLTFPNVLVTGHQAFLTEEALDAIAETTLSNVESFFLKGELPNEICYKCADSGCPRKTTGRCW
jgi:D-lactate dehydrogenase